MACSLEILNFMEECEKQPTPPELCFDIMEMVGHQVETIRTREKFKKCLEQITTPDEYGGRRSVIKNIVVVKDPNGKYIDNKGNEYYWFWDSRRTYNPFESGIYLVYDVGLDSELYDSDLPWRDICDDDDSILYLWGSEANAIKYHQLLFN